MNKTVTMNLGGIVFHIEEDAFEKLRHYLDNLRLRFSKEEGGDEILADIELRIAELLKDKKGPAREAVVMKDIDEVIAIMGEPEVITEENGNHDNKEQEEQTSYYYSGKKRLFRDPDDRVIGGVCSGLGHYFNVDPVWIRLGFALIFFLGGTGLLFYILLMIIIPRAETTAEKLEMRGEPVDINNISKTIKEEFEGLGSRMKNFGKDAQQRAQSEFRGRRRRGPEDFFQDVIRIAGRFAAFLMITFGIFLLIGLLTGTFSVTEFGPDLVVNQVRSLFDDTFSYYVGIISVLLFFGMPIMMMIYYGFKILFRVQRPDKWVGISALGLWITGIVLGIISITNVASGFSETAEVSEEVAVPSGDTLSLRVNIDRDMINEDFDDHWNRKHRFESRWKMVSANEHDLKFGYADLDILPSKSGQAELVIYKKAMGRDEREAAYRADQIRFPVQVNGKEIVFPSSFTIGEGQAWKGQEVQAELYLPENAVIFLDETTTSLLDDIDNTTNTLDEDMADRRWKMTSKGLECVDCAGLGLKDKQEIQPAADSSGVKSDTIKQ